MGFWGGRGKGMIDQGRLCTLRRPHCPDKVSPVSNVDPQSSPGFVIQASKKGATVRARTIAVAIVRPVGGTELPSRSLRANAAVIVDSGAPNAYSEREP